MSVRDKDEDDAQRVAVLVSFENFVAKVLNLFSERRVEVFVSYDSLLALQIFLIDIRELDVDRIFHLVHSVQGERAVAFLLDVLLDDEVLRVEELALALVLLT